MADNKDPNNSREDNDSLDDEFDLDLDLFDDESDERNEDQEDFFTIADSEDDLLESELHDDLHDDLTDDLGGDLDGDVIDLSDEEVQAEFAELEREVSRADVRQDDYSRSETGNTEPVSNQNQADLEDELRHSFGEEFELDGPVEAESTQERRRKINADPDMSDDLDSVLSREEFGAPDQDYKKTPDDEDGKSKKVGLMAMGSNLPAMLAPLASLSPKMIMAATAAVLLPLVIFTVLGLNSGDSDTINATTQTISLNSEPVATDNVSPETNTGEPTNQSLPEPPDPEIASATVLPAEESPYIMPAATEELVEAIAAEDAQVESAATEPEAPAVTPGVDTSSDADSIDTAALFAQTTTDTDPDAASTSAQAEPTDNADVATASADAVADDEQPPGAALAADETDDAMENPTVESIIEPNVATNIATDSERTSTGRDYHVIVASLPNEAQAMAYAERISDEEISAYVIPPFGSASNYRVAVASYATMTEAQANIPGLRAVYGDGIWPLRYPPAAEVPLVSGRSGGVFIIVASFPNETLARTHADTLIAASEQPAIIAPYAPANRYRVAVARFNTIENAQSALPDYRQRYGEDLWLLSY